MQHDFDITTADANTGATMRTQINAALQALATNSALSTEPGTKYPFMWWADSVTDTLKQRNAANNAWVSVLTLSTGVAVSAAEAATLGGSTLVQVLAAVPNNMPAAAETVAGKIEIATQAEVLAGTDAVRAITPAGLASFAKALTANGYAKLPGGLILQWGIMTTTGNPTITTFPIAFPSACVNVNISGKIAAVVYHQENSISDVTLTGFLSRHDVTNLIKYWFALGY